MGVRLPDFSELGFGDPRSTGGIPTFPQEDPAAAGEKALGTGLAHVGDALADISIHKTMQANRLNAALATADLDGNIVRTKEAIKNETDPAKIDALKGQLQGFLSSASQTITDPDARALWTAQHSHKVNEANVLGDLQQRKVYNDKFLAGALGQLDDQSKIAAQAPDPADRETAQRNVGQIIGSLTSAGVISEVDAQKQMKGFGEKIITGHAHYLDANDQPQAALDYLRQNQQHVDPQTLDALVTHLKSKAEKQGVKGDTDALWGGSDKGYAGSRVGGGNVEQTLDLIEKHESGGRNIPQNVVPASGGYNPSTGTVTGPSTAQGNFQITNTTWNQFASEAGVDTQQYPNAMAAPYDVQRKVARTILTSPNGGGVQHWANYNKNLRSALAGASAAAPDASTDLAKYRAEYDALKPVVAVRDATTPTYEPPPSGKESFEDWMGHIHPEVPLTAAAEKGSSKPGEYQVASAAGDVPAPGLPPMRDITALEQRAQDKADSGEWTQEHANAVQGGLRSRYNHEQSAQAVDRATLMRTLNNGAAMLADGRDFEFDPAVIRHFLPRDKADEIVQQLQDAKEGGQLVAGLRTASPDQIAQQRAKLAGGLADPNATDYAKRSRMLKLFDSALTDHQNALIGPKADPISYLADNNPVVQQARAAIDPKDPQTFVNFATTALSEQARLGVPPEQQHVVSANAAQQLAHTIATDAEHAPDTMRTLAAQYGQAWPNVWNDLITLGKLPAGFQVVGQLADYDQTNAAVLARALGATTKDDKAFKSLVSSKAVGGKSIEDVARQTITTDERIVAYERSLADSGASPSQIVAIRSGIEHLAAGRSIFLHEDPSDATEKAIDAVVGHYQFMPNGGGRVPADKFSTVSDNAGAVLSGLSLDNIDVPKIYGSSPGEPKPEEYLSMLQAAPNWITGPKADRLLLLDHGGRLVTDKMGAPVSVRFDMPAIRPRERVAVPVIGDAP